MTGTDANAACAEKGGTRMTGSGADAGSAGRAVVPWKRGITGFMSRGGKSRLRSISYGVRFAGGQKRNRIRSGMGTAAASGVQPADT